MAYSYRYYDTSQNPHIPDRLILIRESKPHGAFVIEVLSENGWQVRPEGFAFEADEGLPLELSSQRKDT